MRALRFGLRIACCQVWVRAGMCIMCLVGGMSMTRLRLLGQSHVHASCQRRRQHGDSLKKYTHKGNCGRLKRRTCGAAAAAAAAAMPGCRASRAAAAAA